MRWLPALGALAILAAHAHAEIGVGGAASQGVMRIPPPVPPPRVEPLRARVIEVKGRAQWRPSDEDPWKNAKVDDVLGAGADIRTGLRSSIALRVGKNATVLIDRATRLSLPVLVQEGETLRTRAAVRRGRADFKVNLIGLTNDFQVLTPSTTLAVRGTGFAVTWGALEGVRIDALSADVIAVELRYLLSQLRYLLRSGATSTQRHPDPVVAALFESFDLPPAAFTEDEFLNQFADDAFLRNPKTVESRRILNSLIGVESVNEFLEMFEDDDEPEPPEPPRPQRAVLVPRPTKPFPPFTPNSSRHPVLSPEGPPRAPSGSPAGNK